MKRKFIIYTVFACASLFVTSCLEEDEQFAKKTEAPGTILFVVPDAALPVPPAGQPTVVQPSLDLVAGRFPKAGSLQVTIQVPQGYSDISVNVVTSAGVRQTKATFSGVSGQVDWTAPLNTLNVNNTAVTSSAVYEFIATGSKGTIRRMFTVTGI